MTHDSGSNDDGDIEVLLKKGETSTGTTTRDPCVQGRVSGNCTLKIESDKRGSGVRRGVSSLEEQVVREPTP